MRWLTPILQVPLFTEAVLALVLTKRQPVEIDGSSEFVVRLKPDESFLKAHKFFGPFTVLHVCLTKWRLPLYAAR